MATQKCSGLCWLAWMVLVLAAPAWGTDIIVDTLSDTGGASRSCELRSAIEAANTDTVVYGCTAGNGDDVISFGLGGQITLTADLPPITNSLIIDGPGIDQLIISGAGAFRPFEFAPASGANELRNFSLLYGHSAGPGGCIISRAEMLLITGLSIGKCESDDVGGAVAAITDVNIERSTINSSRSALDGGAIWASTGQTRITDSTLNGNEGNSGGALALAASVTVIVERSTFYNNKARLSGGAIAVSSATASISLISSTINSNIADSDQNSSGHGGGAWVAGTLSLENTIVAGNTDHNAQQPNAPDISVFLPVSLTSNGYNLIGSNADVEGYFAGGNPNLDEDIVGTAISPVVVQLEPMANYGGPTQTLPPAPGSIVIDQGNCPTETEDQRGYSNPDTGLRAVDEAPADAADGCDIGAVELPLVQNLVFEDSFESN